MRVNQIIPFSVVILLITVSFAGIAAAAAPSEVGAIGTQLNATASVTSTKVNTNFTINGTLNTTSGAPIQSATIQLQNSTNNATWNNVTNTTTDANGNYSFSNNESVAGTYYYRTTYAGYSTDYYLNATSNVVNVTVTPQTTSNTLLNATAAPPTTPVNTTFTINGTLSVTGGAGIYNQTITLQNTTTGANVTNTKTDANGKYSFSNSESAVGTYYYQTTYAGNASYNSTTSNVVNVTVTPTPPIATTLNATANVTSTEINTNFTINGTLSENTSGAGISGQIITLQISTDNATWSNVTTTTTNSSGFYQFSQSEPDAGLYYYRTTYDGNTVYSNAISLVVTEQVGIPTTLTATANVTSTEINTNFTINGTLSVTGGAGIYNQTITLQNTTTGANVTNTKTDPNGNYSFSISESAPGTYQFQTTYASENNLFPATSAVVPVNVGTTTLTAIPNVTSTEINTNFTINGTLSVTGGAGIANANITLQGSTDNATWNNVAANVTNASGIYTFNQSEPTLNTYYFRTTYAGNTTYGSATGTVVSVLVNTSTTQLTAVAAPEIAPVNTNFTISGTLNDTSGTPIGPGATISLENANTSAVIATTTTDTNGNYSFSYNESTLGTYYYQTIYAGYNNGAIANAMSNVVNVTVTNVTTQLTAVAAPEIAPVNTNFTISGTLNTTNGTTPGPIAGATITLEHTTGATIATNVTNASGIYTFNQSEPTFNTYYFQTTYAGNTTDYYANATSNVVTVQVGIPTTLTATANVTSTEINTNFTINGTLSENTSGAGISGQIITLQNNSSGTWTTVNTTTTNSSGFYQFSNSESVNGTYYYQTTYAGTASILPATSNVVSVSVTPVQLTTTTLTATANVSTTTVNTPFTINGTLNTTSGGITGATITLQNTTTGANVTNTTTGTNGNYSFSIRESAAGTYPFQTIYAGNATYTNATSNTVSVTVTTIGTQLAATANVTSTTVNTNFTISGKLNTTNGTTPGPIAGATITLQNSTNNIAWNNVWTNVTNANGAYQFNGNESVAGTYYYRTAYAGNATYTNATSNVVSVNVTTPPPPVTPTSSPAIVDSLFLFVRGSDNALWYKTWNGATWSNATSLGGNLTSAPAATSPAAGTIDVFVRGTNGGLYEKTTANNGTSWSGWIPLGGQLASGTGPAADARGLNSLDVFVQGTDHVLYYTHWNGAWSAWKSLGGVLTSSPAATSPSTSVIDVFVRSTNGALWSVNSTNNGTTWSAWKSIGGQLASGTGPAADARGLNSLDVFVQGTNQVLYYTHWNGTTWSAWTSLGGVLAAGSSPAATSPGTGQVDISVLGTGNVLWWKITTNSGATWSGWMSVGGI
ncbi:MAG: carboxypeptidase regulatory-like domain-containing protein [Halobacteriota archaeon]|jgi:hypothetical protein